MTECKKLAQGMTETGIIRLTIDSILLLIGVEVRITIDTRIYLYIPIRKNPKHLTGQTTTGFLL